MNKSAALQQIIVALQRNLDGLQAAVKVAHESATHGESVAENKYDTRGLEASYLAHGQAKRAAEIEAALRLYQAIAPESLSDQATTVTISSLVELKDQHGVVRWVWPGVDAGGVAFVFEGNDVTIITPQSPLGAVLMGRLELNPEGRSSGRLQNDLTMEYEIMTIY